METESWKLNYLFHRESKPNIANDEPKEEMLFKKLYILQNNTDIIEPQ